LRNLSDRPRTVSKKHRTAGATAISSGDDGRFASFLVYVNVHTEIALVHKCFLTFGNRPKFNKIFDITWDMPLRLIDGRCGPVGGRGGGRLSSVVKKEQISGKVSLTLDTQLNTK
jgi:hypothetical protein